MSVVTIPELLGDYIEATYCNGVLIGSKGRSWDHLVEISTPGFTQAIVFIGKVVKLKDGREIAVFEDFRTFGKAKHFPLYSHALEFIERVGLYCPVPYPILRPMPLSVLFEWSIDQPYHFTRLMQIVDDTPDVPTYLDISSTGSIVNVSSVEWYFNSEMNLVPTIFFDKEVPHLGATVISKTMKNALALKMNGIGVGCKLAIYETWIKNLEIKRVYYPTRCPNCNSVLKETTFHLTCLKCKENSL